VPGTTGNIAKSPILLAVMGSTASGKSALAEMLADQWDAVIINADAFQIYQGMDIGTAKPQDQTRYELLDIKAPNEDFGVGEFVLLAAERLRHHFEHGRNVIVCGGTGFYVRALFEEFQDLEPAPDPKLRAELDERIAQEGLQSLVNELLRKAPHLAIKTDLKNPVRVRRSLEKALSPHPPISFSLPPFRKHKFALSLNVENSYVKIIQRTQSMIQNGWVHEVKQLLSQGYRSGDPGFRAIGYELIEQCLLNDGQEQDLIDRIVLDTVQYAKRQRTWLRSEPHLMQYSYFSEAYNAALRIGKS
jgi:tRNA dimethylallyltransferase